MLGRSVGNYQLVSKIGEGGMGVVYLARHVTLGRPAAVKVLLPELSVNPDVVARFFNEARATTTVRNPGIVEVFDFGFLDERCAYIVMEYLEGESLAARIRRGRSTVIATLTIVRAIARALQAAHELSIVHRDLKPDNVFLVPDADLPTGERVKLLDFGIAKLASSISETSHTRTGTVIGTPTYMAPEQCRGAGSVDHRADLYALGCVAYEMLCGTPPFVAEGAGDLIARHLYFQPQPLRAHRPDLRVEVEEFVLWLLQKDPGARPSTATDVVHAVDRLAAAAPTVAIHSEPSVVITAAPRPAGMDTTLSGAASIRTAERPATVTHGSKSMRIRLLAGAVTAAAILLIVLVARSGAQPDVVPSPSATEPVAQAPAGELRRGGDVVQRPDSPAGPAVSKPQLPSSGDTPAPESRPPVDPVPGRRPVDDSGGADRQSSQSIQSSHSGQPVPLRPVVEHTGGTTRGEVKPPEPSAPGSASKPTDAARPSDGRTPSTTAKSNGCTRGAFAAVLDTHSPGEAAVQAALARLQRCKQTMDPAVYRDIQRRLIAKL